MPAIPEMATTARAMPRRRFTTASRFPQSRSVTASEVHGTEVHGTEVHDWGQHLWEPGQAARFPLARRPLRLWLVSSGAEDHDVALFCIEDESGARAVQDEGQVPIGVHQQPELVGC